MLSHCYRSDSHSNEELCVCVCVCVCLFVCLFVCVCVCVCVWRLLYVRSSFLLLWTMVRLKEHGTRTRRLVMCFHSALLLTKPIQPDSHAKHRQEGVEREDPT